MSFRRPKYCTLGQYILVFRRPKFGTRSQNPDKQIAMQYIKAGDCCAILNGLHFGAIHISHRDECKIKC